MVTPVSFLPLSVVIVAKNEAHTLPRCLASLQGWVAEIVVALNDTTDASASIARAAGAHVHTLPWRGYRDTKNAALDLATHQWVLSLARRQKTLPFKATSAVLRASETGMGLLHLGDFRLDTLAGHRGNAVRSTGEYAEANSSAYRSPTWEAS